VCNSKGDKEENCPKKVYRLARTRQERSKDIDRIVFIKDEQSKIRSGEKDIKERWKKYLKKKLLRMKHRNPK